MDHITQHTPIHVTSRQKHLTDHVRDWKAGRQSVCFFVIDEFVFWRFRAHYCDVIMSTMASQITSLTIVCWIVYSDSDQRKHQNTASLAIMWGIHRWPVNFPHKGPATRKMFPFDDVIMYFTILSHKLYIIMLFMRLLISFQSWRTKIKGKLWFSWNFGWRAFSSCMVPI